MLNYVWVRPHHRQKNGKRVFVRGYYRMMETNEEPQYEEWKKKIGKNPKRVSLANRNLKYANFQDINLTQGRFHKDDLEGAHFGGNNVAWRDVEFSSSGLRSITFEKIKADFLKFRLNNLDYARIEIPKTKETFLYRNNAHKGLFLSLATKENEAGKGWVTLSNNDFSLTSNEVRMGNYIEIGDKASPAKVANFDSNNINAGDSKDSTITIYADDVLFLENQMRNNIIRIFSPKEFTVRDNNFAGSYIKIGDNNQNRRSPFRFRNNHAEGAFLDGDWRNIDFLNTSLRGATLHGDFRGCTFTGVDFRGANLKDAIFDSIEKLNRAVIDKDTILPDSIKKDCEKIREKWLPDRIWEKKNFPVTKDTIFENGAKKYDLSARRSLQGGTSPVFQVKINGDGFGVEKLVEVDPSDIHRRPNETDANFDWRSYVVTEHNGVNEVIGYRLSELLGAHVVPDTVWTHRTDGRPVTIQKFIEHADVLNNLKPVYDDEYEKRSQTINFLDVLMGNHDRHGGNLMLQIAGNSPKLWAIDFGHSKPKRNELVTAYDGSVLAVSYTAFQKYDKVPNRVWSKIKTITRKEFMDMFDDLLKDNDFVNLGGWVALDHVWEKIETIKESKDRLYGEAEI